MSDGSGSNFDDFVLAVSAVFDDASSRQVIREQIEFAQKMTRLAGQQSEAAGAAQTKGRDRAYKAQAKAQADFNRRWSESEKQQARALLLVTREFFRERALQERESRQDERRQFERDAKQQLADRRAAQQRQGKILDEGLKQASARLKSGLKVREQDNASGLRRFENQEKEAARNLERLAKEQARERERIAKEAAANLARIEKERIAQALLASKEQSAVARREGERLAQQQRQQDRLLFNSEQESSARRIARSKALYSTLTTIARSGAQATTNVVTSFFRRRENAAKQTGDRITNIDRSTTNRSTSIIRQQLDEQNAVYSRAASKRLATIERTAAQERVVITRNAVKTAEAQAEIQRRTSSGLLGAATGRSVAGGNLQGFLYGAAGLYGIKKLVDASSDLAESQSKVRVVFGENSKAAEDFAARASRAIGESEQATLEAAGTYGNLFQSFGLGRDLATEYSISLVKLASDLASFNNTSVQDAIEALRSGLTGETEPLKRYGIAINETLLKQEAARLGIVKSTVSQTALTKSTIATEKAQRKVTEAIKKYGASSLEARDAQASLDAAVEKAGKTLAGKTPAQLTSAQKAQAAYSLIMQRSTLAQGDFNRTQAGFANQSRIVVARLKDLQAAAGNGLLPIALALAGVFNNAVLPALESFTDVTSGLIRNLAEGKGGWKIARDGITGVAVALGALLAVKAGAEVLGIVADGLKLIGGAVVAFPGLAALVALAGVGTILYRNAPGVKNFFDSLIEGSKNWYLVGYRISQPIENLSKLVLLQSSFGAAAAVVVDGFKAILRGVDDLRSGLGTDALEEALRQTLRGLGDVLSPAKNLVADSLRESFKRGRDFLNNEALPILQQARLNVGSFLLPLLGLTGGDGGVVSRLVSSAITKLFLGSITAFDPTRPSAELGAKAREIIDRAIEIAQTGVTNVRAFFSSLFGADVDTDSLGSILGGRVNEAITSAFSRLKERLGPIGDLLSSIGDAIATGFGRYVLPKLIELPRIAGRFISRTVFSEEFLKAVTITGAAIAGVALVVAGQFVRGFIEGLIQRRGDIAETVRDILVFVVKTVIGSGNPLVLIGGALVAAFAGAKVLGAIGNLRAQFGIAAAGMTGDAQKLQAAVAKAQEAKGPASTSKVGNAALAVATGFQRAQKFVVDTGKAVETAGNKTVAFSGKVDDLANRILKLPLGTQVNAAGRLVNRETGRFVRDTTKDLGSVRRLVGRSLADLAGELGRAGARVERFPRQVQVGLQKAERYVRDMAGVVRGTIPEGFSKAEYAAQTGAIAISGYMTGLAEQTETKVAGIVATLSQIGFAFATNGPILGAITAAVGVISYFWGESTRASNKAKAEQKRIAEEAAASSKVIQDAYREAFKELGSTGPDARGVATLKAIQAQINENSKGVEDFTRKFGGSWSAVTEAARQGNRELKLYTDGLIASRVRAIFAGNSEAIKAFRTEVNDANVAAARLANGGMFTGDLTREQSLAIGDLTTKLRAGKISFDDYTAGLLENGASLEQITRLTGEYARVLREGLGSSAGGRVIASLASDMAKTVREQDLMEAAQQRVNRELSSTASIAERFTGAWNKVKEGIDRAVSAYQSWIDATQGGRQTRNESIISILGAAREYGSERDPSWDGPSDLEYAATRENMVIEQARNAGAQLAQIWKDAGGNVDTFNANARAYFDELRAAAPNDEAKDFISQVQDLAMSPQEINLIVNSAPPIKSLEEIQTKLSEAISLPGNEKYRIDLSTEDGTKRVEALGSELAELYNSDPTVKAYIDAEFPGGFAEAYTTIVADTGFLDQLTATAKADLDPTGFEAGKALITSGLDELEKRETKLKVRPVLTDPTGGWTKLFGWLGLDLSVGGSPKSSLGDSAPPGFNNAERRWGGIDSFARGGFTQAHIQRRQRIKYAEPETGGEAYIPRRGIRSRSEAILRQAAGWVGGTFIPGGRAVAMRSGGVWGDTSGWQFRNGWWYDRSGRRVGYAPEEDREVYDRPGGRRIGPAIHVPRQATMPVATARPVAAGPWGDTSGWQFRGGWWYDRSGRRIGYSPEEDREVYSRPGGQRIGPAISVPRASSASLRPTPSSSAANAQRDCCASLTRNSASNAAYSTPRAQSETFSRTNLDGSMDVIQRGTNTVVEHFSAAVVKLNKIMESVSKSMTKAEAEAAVLAAGAAQRERGAGAFARWQEALIRFFSGGMQTIHDKGTEYQALTHKPTGPSFAGIHLPKPERPRLPAPSRSSDTPQTVINRNLTVQNTIVADPNPALTALQVVRKAKDSDFLAGGKVLEMVR